MSKGIVGGTFDILHDGHHALLITAFRHGDDVIVGVLSDATANASRERTVSPFDERAAAVREACMTYENVFGTTFTIENVTRPHDRAVESDADYIVVSPEQKTHERVTAINQSREENGDRRLKVIEAPMVLDYEGRKISSTRIANNEIGAHGKPRR